MKNLFWHGRRALGDAPKKMLGESLWRWWARRTDARLNRDQLWDMVEPYERPKSMAPLLVINIVAFYSGVVAAAVTEQLHKTRRIMGILKATKSSPKYTTLYPQEDTIVFRERYWVEHPGQAIPFMKPVLYWGPYKVRREDFGEDASG